MALLIGGIESHAGEIDLVIRDEIRLKQHVHALEESAFLLELDLARAEQRGDLDGQLDLFIEIGDVKAEITEDIEEVQRGRDLYFATQSLRQLLG